MDRLWLAHARLVTAQGVFDGALQISSGRIAAIRRKLPSGAKEFSLRGAYLAPGFIDLHVWGEPNLVARKEARYGTTAFLTTLGPAAPKRLLCDVSARTNIEARRGAACLGMHLEGPFLNPRRCGTLPPREMRRPTIRELNALGRAARGRLRLITIAPELPGSLAAIRWCRRHGIAASCGHTDADRETALRAVSAGATSVTHVFNCMRRFHHREQALLNEALTLPRLTTMVIADGIHVSRSAFRLLVRAKGTERIALVTDSVRHKAANLHKRGGAYYDRRGALAGSALTMLKAVRNAMTMADLSLHEAVYMASEVPSRLLGLGRSRGALKVGRRADLVAFDRHFRVLFTIVGGQFIYQRQ